MEPTGADAGLYPVTVTTERPIVVEAPAKRIAVLDPGGASILDGLGVGRRGRPAGYRRERRRAAPSAVRGPT